MVDCIFCKINTGEIPSHTVYEDAEVRAFLDIYPATDGHTIVIHKRHEEKITGYGKEELGAVFSVVAKVARALEATFGTTILSVGINHGEPAGVHHMHVHLLPRFEGDGGGIIQTLPGKKPHEDIANIAKRMREQLG
jgi:histidine triad (HIT) family protein